MRPIILLGTLLTLVAIAGCLGDEALNDPLGEHAAPEQPSNLPEGLSIQDGETVEADQDHVTYVWDATAEAGILIVGHESVDPITSTTFEVPNALEMTLSASLTWDASADADLQLILENGEGYQRCYTGSDDGEASCPDVPIDSQQDRDDWTVKIRTVSSTDPVPARVEITLKTLKTDHEASSNPTPSVVVAVPDTGINPYHEIYHRPDRTEHPCTYIEEFPCSIPALNLTLDADSYEEALEADQERWDDIEPGDWYWIPQTVFVAVHCEGPFGTATASSDGPCILDTHGHGTGTTSSALTENPEASIAFKEGGPSVRPFEALGIPVDIYSVSWGHIAPIPAPAQTCPQDENLIFSQGIFPIYVKSAGNEPGVSSLLDCWSGHPNVISVGGAYAEDDTQELLAYKEVDVVSYFCRPTADTETLAEMRESYCGTSFAGPTVAGALSKVIYEVRNHTGYTGTTQQGDVDPMQGLTASDLRDALNRTATYEPEPRYENTFPTSIPLNPVAPWTQWGWGFYDGLVADATIDHLLGIQPVEPKPDEAQLYMDTLYTARETLYGGTPDASPLTP